MYRYCWRKKDLKNIVKNIESKPVHINKCWEIDDKGKIYHDIRIETRNLYARLDNYSAMVELNKQGRETGEIDENEKEILEIIKKEYKMPISLECILFGSAIAAALYFLLYYLKH